LLAYAAAAKGSINADLGDENDLSIQPSLACRGLVPEHTTSEEFLENIPSFLLKFYGPLFVLYPWSLIASLC
jgi:hypothetical protein